MEDIKNLIQSYIAQGYSIDYVRRQADLGKDAVLGRGETGHLSDMAMEFHCLFNK